MDDESAVRAAARTFESDVAALRAEVRRIMLLFGETETRVRMNTSNAVPDVELRWERDFGGDPQCVPAVPDVGPDGSESTERIHVPTMLRDTMRNWHAEHPFCRVVFRYVPYVWSPTAPFDPAEWHAALRAVVASKRRACAVAKTAANAANAAANAAKADKVAAKTAGGKRPVATKADPPAKRAARKAAPDACETVTLTHWYSTQNQVQVVVKITTSPSRGTVCLDVLSPGREQTKEYAVGDCVWTIPFECSFRATFPVSLERVTAKRLFVYQETRDFGAKTLVHDAGSFAAKVLGMKYLCGKRPAARAAKHAVQSATDLDVLATALVGAPERIHAFLDILDSVPEHVVPSETVFAALHAAHVRAPATDATLHERIKALVETLSKPSTERIAASMAAAY